MNAFNAQQQQTVTWTPSTDVAQAYLDQMVRNRRILRATAGEIQEALDGAEAGNTAPLAGLAERIAADAAAIRAGDLGGDAYRMEKLAEVLSALAG